MESYSETERKELGYAVIAVEVDEMHYAKSKKPDSKGHMIRFHLHDILEKTGKCGAAQGNFTADGSILITLVVT